MEPLILVDNGACHVSIHNIVDGAPSRGSRHLAVTQDTTGAA